MEKPVPELITPEGINAADITDLRDLEAPEPMVKILMACTHMDPDAHYVAHLPHVPEPLFPQLQARGLAWEVYEQADGSALVVIRREV